MVMTAERKGQLLELKRKKNRGKCKKYYEKTKAGKVKDNTR